MEDSVAALPKLLDFCRQGGVQWHGIEAGFVAEGWRGVLATQELLSGACVLRVPRRLLMTVESAARDPDFNAALQQCSSSGVRLSSEQVLAAHLLHECSKGSASFWHPYLRTLPRAYTTAMCFTEAEAAALQVPAVTAAARAAAAAALAQHAGALPLLRVLGLAPNWRSRGAWLWAASTLSSRTMHVPYDSAGALTPYGDLFNFRPPPPPVVPTLPDLLAAAAALRAAAVTVKEDSGRPEAAAAKGGAETQLAAAAPAPAPAEEASNSSLAGDGSLDEVADEYCIYARVGYQAGEQVFLCYGRHTNLELLTHYGFVLPDNSHDTAALPPRLLPPAVRLQLAGTGNGGEAATSSSSDEYLDAAAAEAAYLHAASGAPSWDLLRALRLGCATVAERKAGAYLALSDHPISADSERAAFQALRGACEAALRELLTTVEQDEVQLAALRSTTAPAPPPVPAPAAAAAAEEGEAAAGSQTLEEPQERQVAERMCVAVEWRLCHKRILRQGVALCDAVLASLPPLPQQAAAVADISARLIALQRKPRW